MQNQVAYINTALAGDTDAGASAASRVQELGMGFQRGKMNLRPVQAGRGFEGQGIAALKIGKKREGQVAIFSAELRGARTVLADFTSQLDDARWRVNKLKL